MTDSPLTRAHRAIRSIAPPDVPVAGVLSTYGDETALFVPVEDVDARLWAGDTAEHLWAPIDLARRQGGVDAVLPWCSTTLARLLQDRRGEPLHGGEVVTLAVSLLRGVREATEAWGVDDVVTGQWWISENGRPLFVRGDGAPVRAGTAARLDEVGAACSDAVVAAGVSRVRELIDAPGPLGPTDDVERALFHLAAPRPVGLAVSTAPASTLPLSASGLTRVPARFDSGAADERPFWRVRAAAVIDDVRERLRGRRPRDVDTADSRPPAKRRRVIVMAVVTVLVVGVALWSLSGDGGAEPHPGTSTFTREPTAAASDDGTATEAGQSEATNPDTPNSAPPDATNADPVVAASALLPAARACAADPAACTGITAPRDVLARIPTDGPVMLVDDYGGMAVVGVGEPAVSVLLERVDDVWRIRDVPAGATSP